MYRIARFTAALLALALFATPTAFADDPITTEGGVKVEILKAGKAGTAPKKGDILNMSFELALPDGTLIDSTERSKRPLRLTYNQTILPGLWEGLAHATDGASLRLSIPWKLAFGEKGNPAAGIPPKSAIVFKFENIEVIRTLGFHALGEEGNTTTSSGLVWKTLEAGKGPKPRPDQGVGMRAALFSEKGVLLFSTDRDNRGQALGGLVSALRLGRNEVPFLAEAAQLMQVGGTYAFKVPSKIGFGDKDIHPQHMPPGATSYWTLELIALNDVPKFSMPPAEKIKKTGSGLEYEIIEAGTGAKPTRRDEVEVHYTGWLTDGTVFDSSHARGETTSFRVGGVIPGWTEGLQIMKVGATYKFVIPGHMAYGERGSPPTIGPNATLVFLVELKAIK